MNALIVKNAPVNGILYTQIFPFSREKEEELLRIARLHEDQKVIHEENFDLQKYIYSV